MSNTAEISEAQFNSLKSYGLDKALISPNNIRTRQPLNDRIVFFYSACLTPPVKPKVNPSGDFSYIKATQNLNMYALANASAPFQEVWAMNGDPKDRNKIKIGNNIEL